ncbi:hypothetical protein G0Q06_03050 [Puniceicoccales bacterium CK1056]|uniref:Uncharacterized protein n=1 Tax=Oceanipulchritudo coccoides TaxID=2706888 RepID=A0A6B2M126_9BACT|nr:hypothetical protein [Oceanipulchritudo coccoides]NDV61420.1 hypothetical protein [Oceanipulchritudo coccoides]
MKIKFQIAWFLAIAAPTLPEVLYAGGVNENQIPENVEWLVHIDADQLRATRSGALLIEELIAISEANMGPEVPINPVLAINGIRSLTAFGTMPDFESGAGPVDGVLVLEGTEELMQVFRGLVSGMELEKPEAIERVQVGDNSILKLKGEDFSGIFLEDSRIAIGKSQVALENYLSVEGGEQAHLSLEERFTTNKLGEDSGIYVGAFIEGLNGLQQLPAQARILQLTKQVSLQLGESGDLLQLFVSLGTDSIKTATQVHDVLQGMIALMSITQSGNPDLAALIQSAKALREDANVHLQLAYPVEAAEAWIGMISDLIAAKQAEEAAEAAEAAAAEQELEESADEAPVEESVPPAE